MGEHVLGRLDPGFDFTLLRRHGACESGVGVKSAHAVTVPDGSAGSVGRCLSASYNSSVSRLNSVFRRVGSLVFGSRLGPKCH